MISPHQIGALPVLIDTGAARPRRGTASFELYGQSDESPAFIVEVVGSTRDLNAHSGMYEDGFAARFGFFYVIRFRPELPTPTAQVAVRKNPLLAVRPFLDYEFHRASDDLGKYIHEVAITGLSQMRFADRFVFVHGAAMADPAGRGVLMGGTGGVGKTSLALELGRSHGWRFISDDLVGLDPTGHMHLNANWPKIYAYNALEDPELEQLLLDGRSLLNRLHWAMRKRRPDRVRRSVPPKRLYPAGVQATAPLRLALILERYDGNRIAEMPLTVEEAAARHAHIIEGELERLGTLVRRWMGSRADSLVEWGQEAWSSHIAAGLARAHNYRIQIPQAMSVGHYRREMPGVIESLLD